MEFLDILSSFAYITLILLVAIIIRGLNKNSHLYRKYFIPGLFVKFVGAISYVSIYQFYYNYGGDASTYFHDAKIFSDLLLSSPFDYFDLLISNVEYVNVKYYDVVQSTIYKPGQAEWFTAKFASFITFFGMGNYLTSTILFSSMSYIGIWKLFMVFAQRYPKIHGKLAFSILFVPSVFFWGSGITKDCIVIGFLGLLLFYADSLIRQKGFRRAFSLFMVALCSYVVFNTKAYVIMSLLPAILLWVVMSYREKIRSPFVRKTIVPFLIVFLGISVAATIQFLGNFSAKYSIDNVLSTAQGMQSWHQVQTHTLNNVGRGSSYTLGEYDESIFGILKMAPASVNVTLFRPYPTEVRSIVMAIASLESMIVLVSSIYVFIGLGIFRIPKIINKDPFLLMALTFALFFAFAVGFSSYNFGALVRYKIPCIPFYVASLYILQHEARLLKKKIR